ncbi:MAG: DNA topoisomerase IV subunit A [Alphaproteobacteria bacterium]
MNLKVKDIEDKDFMDTIGERYLAYALSTIMSRSLPDVRDGLKPVHRRLLYAMLQLKLDPKSGFKKCARVVGDVIGKYHPHGDTAVYETLVRLAQSFSVRYPLVDGQGNFGSIDGDNAAAMRYTEARLTEVALALLEDIDKNTVDFKPTYDSNDEEPALLPASFPNLLANGSEGIAVGMATYIPPHNISELCDALLALIKNPNLEIKDLMEYVLGPDFPTGGIIVESKENIFTAYNTGKGGIRLRARWSVEHLSHGQYQIIVSEIPYQVQKSRLIEKIADLFKEKKLPLLGNIRDESAEEIRIIFEPKNRTCDAEVLMESLFKLTDLEVKINLNMNVLNKNLVPGVMNLKQILEAFLEFRYDLVIRRSKHRLDQINHRLHILEGFLIAYLNLDEVIKIIREEDEAKEILAKKFSLTEIQIEYILNMRLRSLRKLEEIEIKKEHDKLLLEKEELLKITSNEDRCWKKVASEIKDVQKRFAISTELGARRTSFEELKEVTNSISIEAFLEKEDITIICSKLGWIKSQKGHNVDVQEIKYKDSDEERFVIKASNTDKLIVFVSNGKFYTIACDKIAKGKGHGDSIRMLIDLENDVEILDMFIHHNNRKFFVTSKNGKGFIVEENEIVAQTKSGKQILNLGANDEAFLCKQVEGDRIAIIGTNRKLVIYSLEELPIMKRGQGVTLQKYKHAVLSDVKFFHFEKGLSWSLGGRNRVETNLLPWIGKRGSIGRLPPVGFPRSNKFE